MIKVWCDGSGVPDGPGGIGVVTVYDDPPLVDEASLPLPHATNQQAEILAAAYALHLLVDHQIVEIHSDSEYLVKGINEKRKRKKNQRHWARLDREIARHKKVTFHWLRGHDGHEHNERADALAGEARRSLLSAAPSDRLRHPGRG